MDQMFGVAICYYTYCTIFILYIVFLKANNMLLHCLQVGAGMEFFRHVG